jgi:two-component system sensor histidine kinase MtrB
MRGIRARLTATIVGLVAVTAAVLGIGAYLFVDFGLRAQAVDDAANQARFDLSVLIPERLPGDPTIDDVVSSRLAETFRLRGVESMIRLPSGATSVSNVALEGTLEQLPLALVERVAAGELAYAWTDLAGSASLVLGGRIHGTSVEVYFVRDVRTLESTLAQLRLALAGGAFVLVVIALLAARRLARGVLAPVHAAAVAAERIERGDLSARVGAISDDEFGRWAERFNGMASALEDTIGRLEAAQAQNRRFVADVSHELRTPLAALVAEASILREHLDALPAGSRRAGELLVADIGRLRTLVDDLMELSRFDAQAEEIRREPVELGRLVRAIVGARLPAAFVAGPREPVTIETDPRRIERILGNLLDNAREHAAGTAVDVEIGMDQPGDAVIAVSDRGPGIAPDRLGRIFERFYKLEASRHAGSSGLGLAIAHEHATLLGGTLVAANRPDGGLRVELRLPVTQSLQAGDPPAIDERHDGVPSSS